MDRATSRWNLWLVGALLAAGWLAAHAGMMVPLFGSFVASFAPDIFFVGLVLVAIWIATRLAKNANTVGVLAVALSIVLGLNTRLPTLISDYVHSDGADDIHVTSKFVGAVGQPVHVVAQVPEIGARQYPYSHAIPACLGEACVVTKGFRMPDPALESDYWHEKVIEVVLTSGFSKATQGEVAPKLTVSQSMGDVFATVHIELTDANGRPMSQYHGRYRNSVPFESKDRVASEGKESPPSVFEYLLHGNVLNRLAGRIVPHGEAYPLAAFLKKATNLAHPQGSTLGLMTGGAKAAREPSSTRVALEILEEKSYEPVWVIQGDPNAKRSKWSELSWDAERYVYCKTLLKPEVPREALMQTWHLFINDPSGRKKVRVTGTHFCDTDAIWFLDYVIERDRAVLTRYSPSGDLIYRVSFEKPKEPWGYPGSILVPTFKAENEYVYFEWWNGSQSGSDRHIKRALKVRLRLPSVAKDAGVDVVTGP